MEHREKRTLILRINSEKPEIEKIRIAAEVIRKGGLVAFPTETVYGLGADALNELAVKKIYLAKNRPFDNPTIVHVAERSEVYKLAKKVPEIAEELMNYFWPGPLTLVLEASEIVPRVTRGGLETVAIRMPRHKVALELIKQSRTPIAAPSANLAGRPSPTSAEHVIRDLHGKIDVILDAGSTVLGLESTVLDLTSEIPQILRPGSVSYEDLKRVIGKVEVHPAVLAKRELEFEARSPGMKHRHYAPNAEMVVVEGETEAMVEKVKEIAMNFSEQGKKVGILATDETLDRYPKKWVVKSLGTREDLGSVAKNLFKLLRELENEVDVIIAEGFPEKGVGLAIMNRLRKASNYNVVVAEKSVKN
ncbi:MAG: L-threonylcarbamoyladenylate synthase [Archaeoglobaceae archaeon]